MRPRIIPVLTIDKDGIYRTCQFKKPAYVGDPINAVKIFNEKEVDELVIFDIGKKANISTSEGVSFLKEIASQAFMPMAYGGGVRSFEQAKLVFSIGYEKVILNTAFFESPHLVQQIADTFGRQSVVVAFDVKQGWFSKDVCYTRGGTLKVKLPLESLIKEAHKLGVGEIIIRDISKDGTMSGLNLKLIDKVASLSQVPVIATGGVGSLEDIHKGLTAGAHAIAAGNFFVYQGERKAVLISYPSPEELSSLY